MTRDLAPPRPRLIRGLAVIRTRNGLLIDGALRRYRFTGATATTTLPVLIQALDGQHDIAALSAETGLLQTEVKSMLGVLQSYGLLETGATNVPATLASHVTDYFSRSLRPSNGPGGAGIAQLLSAVTVLLLAPGALARSVAADLRETGAQAVRIYAEGSGLVEAAISGLPPWSRRIAVVFDQPGKPQAFSQVASALRRNRIPLLRCAADAGWVEVGPLFYPDYSACPACFQRGCQEAGWAPAPGTNAADQPVETVTNTLAGLVVQETLALLIGLGRPTSLRALTRVPPHGHAHERYLVTPYQDCPDCGWEDEAAPRTRPSAAAETSILAYEWQLAEPPTALVPSPAFAGSPPRLDALDHQSGRRSPSQSIRDAHYLPRYILSDADSPSTAVLTPHVESAADSAIASVLTGMNRPVPGPSHGPMDAAEADVELYLLTRKGLFGLPGTLYRYDATTHAVITVRTDKISLQQCLEDSGLDLARLSAAVLFVAVARPLSNIGENFSYREALVLAGRTAAQFSVTASHLRLKVAFASRWPETLTGILELRTPQETVAAVASIMLDGKDRPGCP